MNKRYSKKFNLSISELGFGGWQLGNGDCWSDMTNQEGIELVKAAYNKGITFYDTAPGYGNGSSEKILGEALKDCRENVFINTKFGHNHLNETNFHEDFIEKSINESLERLQTTYVDSVILHNPPIEILQGKTNHKKEFNRLKEAGKIRGFGVSIDTYEELELVLNNLDVDVIEILFNINSQAPKYLFEKIKEKGILLIAKIPLDSGWLSGKYNANSSFTGVRSRWNKEEIITRAKIIDKIKTIVNDEELAKYALSFILSFDAVTTIIPGTRNINQLSSNLEAAAFKLSNDIKQKLEKLYEEEIKPLNLPW